MNLREGIAETCEQMLREQQPNLLRLYVNPSVAQTCLCLDRYVRRVWPGGEEYQSFLANSFDEALSGAIKLARYAASSAGRPTRGLVLDPGRRLGPYAEAAVPGGSVVFVPGLAVLEDDRAMASMGSVGPVGLIVLLPTTANDLERHADALHAVLWRHRPLLVVGFHRDSPAVSMKSMLAPFAPDIALFDESFVDRAVPFGAFSARRSLYDHWNRPGKTTFHSTTYQPNTISTLHFLRCFEDAEPEFHAALAPDLARIAADRSFCGDIFRRLYSPSLYRMIRMAGFDGADVRAAGDFVSVDGRNIFDAVSGVACSIRGHNPPGYVEELEHLDEADAEAALAERLHALTGLEHVLPAVSGASAVESALKLALVAQYPRRHVLALKAGFGGKTLLALTGTANPAYKEHIDPLYPDVLYVDPFAADAEAQIDAALAAHPVAVVQLELIQAVGGVRAIPERVVRHLAARRRDAGYLLLVDEVQTGMYRTGPFTLLRRHGPVTRPAAARQGHVRHDVSLRPCAVHGGRPRQARTARLRFARGAAAAACLRPRLCDRAQRARAGGTARPVPPRRRIGGALSPAPDRRARVVQGRPRRARPRLAHRHRAGRGSLAAALARQTALFALPLQHAATSPLPGARRLLPVRAKRPEDHAVAHHRTGARSAHCVPRSWTCCTVPSIVCSRPCWTACYDASEKTP